LSLWYFKKFKAILETSLVKHYLKCGFCKKSFIINNFLRNPHFRMADD
jgi:hypothetical protein